MRPDREQLIRLATFWLRPDFVLRVVARFQSIAGFDRAVALASSALTAMIPVTIFIGAVLPNDSSTADRLISRYQLSGDGAQAVKDAFSPATGVDTSLGIMGALLLLVAVMSFTRAVQRLIERTWELPPLSVRNSVNGLKWIGVLIVYLSITGSVNAAIDHGLAELISRVLLAPLAAGFFMWSARVLSARRLDWAEVLPFGIVAAVLVSVYQIGAEIYMPKAFSTYASRYGVIGAVFALISSLFGMMLAVVSAAAIGREVRLELERIRDGVRPSEDEIGKQWEIVISGARERRDSARAWVARQRQRRSAAQE